jgi:hypothetical protein
MKSDSMIIEYDSGWKLEEAAAVFCFMITVPTLALRGRGIPQKTRHDRRYPAGFRTG